MHSYQVLSVTRDGIARNTVFHDHAFMTHVGVPARVAG
jgi:hypothetical protein